MSAVPAHATDNQGAALRVAFLKWQCRVRQIAMRDANGRPDDGFTPAVILPGADALLGHIITVMNKLPEYSVLSEFTHMSATTQDPAQRLEKAIQFLSATYYQKHREFSDLLTATFPPGSPGAGKILAAGNCRLVFVAYAQRYDLACNVWPLAAHNPIRQATLAHNRLFNPELHPQTEVLGFAPDWQSSSSQSNLM